MKKTIIITILFIGIISYGMDSLAEIRFNKLSLEQIQECEDVMRRARENNNGLPIDSARDKESICLLKTVCENLKRKRQK